MAVSYHTPIRAASWVLAVLLVVAGLPGMLVPPIGYLVARLTARRPETTGKDPWGNPAPQPGRERKDWVSWRRADHWMRGDWIKPAGADVCVGLAFGSLSMLAAYMCAIPALAAIEGRYMWCAWADLLGTCLWVQAELSDMRDGTLTDKGLDLSVRQSRVPWAKKRLKAILAILAGGLFAGALVWALTGWVWQIPLFAAACGIPMRPAHKAAKARFRDEMRAAGLIRSWLESTSKTPVKRPGRVTNLEKGAHGELLFMLETPFGPREWTTDACRDQLAPAARADGMRVGFAIDGSETRHVVCAIIGADPVPAAELIQDKTGWQAALTVDEHRIAVKFSSFPGRIVKASSVATLEGKPAVWTFDVDGSNSTWSDIALNWFPGRDDEWGDWGVGAGLAVTPDKSRSFAWLWDPDVDLSLVEWNAKALPRSVGDDPMGHLSDMFRSERDVSEWTKSLSGFKLDPPVDFDYDRTEDVRSRAGFVIRQQTAVLPRTASVLDYMKPDLAPAFGDAVMAEAMPSPDPARPGAWQMRYLRMLTLPRARRNADAPVTLDANRGTDRASGMLAAMVMSKALRTCLKMPAFVGDATACHRRGDWALWRMPVQLNGGVTPADVRRAEARIRSMAGATRILWQWLDAGHVIAWAGTGLSDRRGDWASQEMMRAATGLALDDAWAQAGAVSADGRTPKTLGVETNGALDLYTFSIPAGMSADDAYGAIDRFQSASGMVYAKRVPSDRPAVLSLLLARRSPLPTAAIASPSDPDPRNIGVYGTLDRVGPGDRVLPFGTLDDGTTAELDPKDTPHLLCSGTTGSGKSSVMVTLTRAALEAGWQVAVADPSKGAKDFAPIENKLLAREETLAGTNALLDWAMAEMHRRRDMIGQAGDLDGLDPSVRPPRLLIVIDEFNSLLTKGGVQVPNPNGDPDIDNKNMRAKWEDGLRAKIGLDVSDLLRQARALNIMLLLGAQKLNASDMDLLPDAGTAKSMLGHVFLGNGDTAGNVSQSNVREANRLLKQAMNSGGMPKGRGLYERMGRGVNMFQAWWGGAGDDLKQACASLPDVEPLNLGRFTPAPPTQIGVMEPEPSTVVEADLSDGEEWSLD